MSSFSIYLTKTAIDGQFKFATANINSTGGEMKKLWGSIKLNVE